MHSYTALNEGIAHNAKNALFEGSRKIAILRLFRTFKKSHFFTFLGKRVITDLEYWSIALIGHTQSIFFAYYNYDCNVIE